MDERAQRYTIETVAEFRTQDALTHDWAKSLLNQYDDLESMARDVAKVVYSMRWPRAYEPGFEISFGEEYTGKSDRQVTASFWSRGDNDSIHFPLAYLFMTYDEIRTAEDVLRDEEEAKAAAQRAKVENEKRSRDFAALKRLREQYPDVAL